MTRSFAFRQLVSLPAGAVMWLLTLALLAPPVAEGGCSHLVTSQADSGQVSSLIEPLMRDLAGQSERIPAPARPRPCSGALCSGQPAAPAVPAELFEGELDSWACLAPVPGLAVPSDSFVSAEPDELQPTRLPIDIFHPPRRLRPA